MLVTAKLALTLLLVSTFIRPGGRTTTSGYGCTRKVTLTDDP